MEYWNFGLLKKYVLILYISNPQQPINPEPRYTKTQKAALKKTAFEKLKI